VGEAGPHGARPCSRPARPLQGKPDYSRYNPQDVLKAAFRKEGKMRTKGNVNAKRIVKKVKVDLKRILPSPELGV